MTAIIIAASLDHARIAAEGWGWEALGPGRWRTDLGEEVRYVATEAQARGLRRPTLYLGDCWWDSPLLRWASQEERADRLVLGDPPVGPNGVVKDP